MDERFHSDAKAIQGRAGVFDRAKGNRLVAFFMADPENVEAAPRMAKICADALNAAVVRSSARQGRLYGQA